MKKFVIVGSGRQGVAVAYDLLQNQSHHVTLVDINEVFLNKALDKISKISKYQNLKGVIADVANEKEMLKILSDIDVMISSVPYEFNLALTIASLLISTPNPFIPLQILRIEIITQPDPTPNSKIFLISFF